MSLFRTEEVTFSSKTEELIHGISLEIEEKQTTIITGNSGSGKSLLMKLLAGILVPTSGKVFFDDVNIQAMSKSQERDFRRRCAMVFQDSALWANQSIEQNLLLPLQTNFPEMEIQEQKERIKEICSLVKYTRDLSLRPANLSAGEQKKIAFARSFICKPEILLLDECTESLDRNGATTIMEILHKFEEQGNTLIYISHQYLFLNEFPGNIIHIENGQITEPAQN